MALATAIPLVPGCAGPMASPGPVPGSVPGSALRPVAPAPGPPADPAPGSSSRESPSGGRASPAPFAIASLAPGGFGVIVKATDGGELLVQHPNEWPTAVLELRSGPDRADVPHDVSSPIVARLLDAMRRARSGPSVDAASLAHAIRWLEMGTVVMSPDWSDVVIDGIVRARPNHFDVSFTKRGVPLRATVARSGGFRGYTNDYAHATRVDIEQHRFGAELGEPFRRARLGAGVSPPLRDELVALLAKPPVITTTATEP